MKTAMKLTTGTLAIALTMTMGAAFCAQAAAQNPDAIDNARSVAKSLQQKQANDTDAALNAAGSSGDGVQACARRSGADGEAGRDSGGAEADRVGASEASFDGSSSSGQACREGRRAESGTRFGREQPVDARQRGSGQRRHSDRDQLQPRRDSSRDQVEFAGACIG